MPRPAKRRAGHQFQQRTWPTDINFTTGARPLAETKFKTCRYWAFGPRCPNIGHNNIELCPYAHRDVGQLASHLEQRGTCVNWSRAGACHLGVRCFYEHRNTGVLGLYQGPIGLNGVDLEIADAAANAGFNTWNHVALYDLIWAIKRIAIRQDLPQKHPVYPDRFRPHGVGDTTNNTRKRKAAARMNNPVDNPPRGTMKAGRAGDPIVIDTDDEREGASGVGRAGLKRQKVSDTQMVNTVQKESSQTSAMSETSTQTVHNNDTRRREILAPRSVAAGQRQSGAVKPEPGTETTDADKIITAELLKVKGTMLQTKETMNNCMDTMRLLFDEHCDRFSDEYCMEMLEALGKCITTACESTDVGAAMADSAMRWLRNTRDRERG